MTFELTTFLIEQFPASEAFDLISSALSSSDAERKDAIKKGGAVFAFTLKNGSGAQESWFIDLKETGTVGKGTAPDGKKSDGMLRLLSSPPKASSTDSTA